ncbi:MAG: histidine phosphatase family protein [Pseudomonadales bacterium]|nr:histidine phosphatase family protein [Pseudomonadales bacterium]
MPRILVAIIRHAHYNQLLDTPSAHQPFPITANGEAEATEASQELKAFIEENQLTLCPSIDSSQLLRAWQTAKILSDCLQDCFTQAPSITCYDDLAERSVGSAANLTVKTIEEIIAGDPRYDNLPPNWKSNSHFKLPLQGAESLLEAGERVAKHLVKQANDLKANVQEDTLKLVVGHGAAFRHAAHHMGILDLDRVAQLSMYHARPVFLELSDDGQWSHVAGEWKVRSKHTQYTD